MSSTGRVVLAVVEIASSSRSPQRQTSRDSTTSPAVTVIRGPAMRQTGNSVGTHRSSALLLMASRRVTTMLAYRTPSGFSRRGEHDRLDPARRHGDRRQRRAAAAGRCRGRRRPHCGGRHRLARPAGAREIDVSGTSSRPALSTCTRMTTARCSRRRRWRRRRARGSRPSSPGIAGSAWRRSRRSRAAAAARPDRRRGRLRAIRPVRRLFGGARQDAGGDQRRLPRRAFDACASASMRGARPAGRREPRSRRMRRTVAGGARRRRRRPVDRARLCPGLARAAGRDRGAWRPAATGGRALYDAYAQRGRACARQPRREFCGRARAPAVPVVISHHKTIGGRQFRAHRRDPPKIAAAMAGQEVGLDAYPYIASSTVLSAGQASRTR